MRLFVNHQLILIAIQPKSISLKQICYKRYQGNLEFQIMGGPNKSGGPTDNLKYK